VRSLVIYAAAAALFLGAMVLVFHFGQRLPPPSGVAAPPARAAIGETALRIILLQTVATLIAAAR
jgi:hypothetical protein